MDNLFWIISVDIYVYNWFKKIFITENNDFYWIFLDIAQIFLYNQYAIFLKNH